MGTLVSVGKYASFFEFNGGGLVQNWGLFFRFLFFHRAPPSRRITALLALPGKLRLYLLIFSLLNFSELILRETSQSGEGREEIET